VPAGQSTITQDIDFTATLGFVLRISAGIDLSQSPAAVKWVLQAIDPLTGEPLTTANMGLLMPNNAQGQGAGYVSWSAQLKPNIATGTLVSESAAVVTDTQPPQTTETLTQAVDETPPTTTLTVTQIGTTNNYTVAWSSVDDAGGSGVASVTLYVAVNGGNYQVWQNALTSASGKLVYMGLAGNTYQFLALAVDNAGNQEQPPSINQSVPITPTTVDVGSTPTVTATTPPNFGQAPAPVVTSSTNALFTAAQQNVPSTPSTTDPSAFTAVLAPFIGTDFASNIAQSEAGIGPQAIVQLPNGNFLVSGGANRGSLYLVPSNGSTTPTLLITLGEPIVNMAFDKLGDLWPTSAARPGDRPGPRQLRYRHHQRHCRRSHLRHDLCQHVRGHLDIQPAHPCLHAMEP
jgi:hypothetical protein